MNVVDFGRRLVETGDLDPIYVALWRMNMRADKRNRWLLAYWMFYSARTASYLSERNGRDFWGLAERANLDPKLPRGRERRHYRGATLERSVADLRERFPEPEQAVEFLEAIAEHDRSYRNVGGAVEEWSGFGPWIAFKVADMLERLGVVDVEFSGEDIEVYDEPRAGAILAGPDLGLIIEESDRDAFRKAAYKLLCGPIGTMPAPPSGDRPLGYQEAETIFCKFKSHRAGHYEVGSDIREIRHALEWASPFYTSETAAEFARHLPEDVPWT